MADPLQLEASYDFDVSIDYDAATADVVERLTLANRGPSVQAVHLFVLPNLDADGFREFTLRSLEVDGVARPVHWTHDGANMDVALPAALGSSASTELRIEFALRVGGNIDGAQAAAVSRAHGVLQLLLWYPLLSDGHGAPRDGDPLSATPVADVTFRIRTTRPLDLAVPGQISRRSPLELAGRLERARDFAFAVSPAFRTWAGRSGDTTVTVFAREGADGATGRDLAVAALDRFGRLLDAPYPASRFVLVAGTMDMESSGIVFVDRSELTDPYKVAHETAHQWFPWLVGSDQLTEPWLDEALATYLGMGLRPRQPEGFCSDIPVDATVYAFPSVALEMHWQDCDGYVQTIYYKGSWMLHGIRRAMGDEAFRAALREYVAANRFGIAATDDLLDAFRHSPAVTDDLLGTWLALGDEPSLPGHVPPD